VIDRRRVLGGGMLALAAAGLGLAPRARALSLDGRASGERVELAFARAGELAPAALARVAWLLRDPDTGEQHPIDAALLDALVAIAATLDVPAAYEVLGGFRSPRHHGAGLHGLGRALDVKLAGVTAEQLAAVARAHGVGGVGLYRAAGFVHLDTGAARSWCG
jgi:uncharacterized protein YcbK (DUF882 family)